MFHRVLVRNGTVEARFLLGGSTPASLVQRQPLDYLLPSIRCLATASALARAFSTSLARPYATAGQSAKSTTTKKPATRKTKTAATKTATTKSTAKAKPKAKPKKKKPKKKATKSKVKPKKRATRAKKAKPTELEAKRAKVNALRKVALLTGPKLLPMNGYSVYNIAHTRKGENVTVGAKTRAREYQNLDPVEKERYEDTAASNRTKNLKTKKDWVETHTVWEVRVANNARRHLNRIAKEPKPAGAGRALVAHGVILLKDDRALKRVDTPFIAFSRERWASGEFKDVRPADASKSLGKEWKALSHEEAKKYHDVYRTERTKFAEEYEKTYGADAKRPSKKTTKKTTA